MKPNQRNHVSAQKNTISSEAQQFRKQQLVHFKNRWLVEGAPDYMATEDEIRLATECISVLKCGDEMVELLDFLKTSGFAEFDLAFEKGWAPLFNSPGGDEARSLLIGLSTSSQYRQLWSYYAGLGTPLEKFDEFCTGLQDSSCIKNALIGKSMQLVASDPVGAVSIALQAKEDRERTSHSDLILENLMDSLPQDAPFPKIEALLSLQREGGAEETEIARQHLFVKWAQSDVFAASRYAIENPNRSTPELFERMASMLAGKVFAEAIPWIQSLPRGPYSDAAIKGAISQMCQLYPVESDQLLTMVVDPKIRESCVSIMNVGEAMMEERRTTKR